MADEPIKAVISEYVDYAHYTYTPNPTTEAERDANNVLEALFGTKITQMYIDLIEKEENIT